MSADILATSPFRVGNFDVRPSINSVVFERETYRLEPRVMEVLCLLAEDPGHVVLRETLIDRLWKVEHGADESVTRAISVLRKTFRRDGADLPYIETLPKRGYRLVAPVETLPGSNAPGAPDAEGTTKFTHSHPSDANIGRGTTSSPIEWPSLQGH